MSLFWLLAAALTALALGIVLPPLLRTSALAAGNVPQPDAGQASLAVLREQLAQLDAEHAAGTIADAPYDTARAEIERRALEEADDAPQPARTAAPASAPAAKRARITAVLVALAVPCLALGLYAKLGNPDAVLERPALAEAVPGGPAGGEVTQAQIEAMVAQMAERLENPPEGQKPDAAAWSMLARSYAALERFDAADRAYVRAIALAPADAQLLADRADVLAMLQGRSAIGEPLKLIKRALKLDPKNLKALALAGSAAFESGDFTGAGRYWGQALALAPPGSALATGLERSLEAARNGAGGPQASAGSISGEVRLAPALAARVAAGDTVYIFARAAQGARMPLAIVRRQAGELPIRFTLDDSMAMSPEMRLSGQTQVVLGARVSRSGQALPQSGDLVGQSGPVAVGATGVALTIDSVQP